PCETAQNNTRETAAHRNQKTYANAHLHSHLRENASSTKPPASVSDRGPAAPAQMPRSAFPPGTGLRHRILRSVPSAGRGSNRHSAPAPPLRRDQRRDSGSNSGPRSPRASLSFSTYLRPRSRRAPFPAEKSSSALAAVPARPTRPDRPAPAHEALQPGPPASLESPAR